MAFTFLAAQGIDVGASRNEDADGQATARKALADAGRARLRAGAAGRRGRRRPLRRRGQDPHGGRRRDPRRLDGPRHRPAHGAALCPAVRRCEDDLLERPDGRVRAGAVRRGHDRRRRGGRRLGGRLRRRRRRLGGGRQPRPASPTASATSPPAAVPRWSWSRARSCRASRRWRRPRMSRRPFVAGNWKMHKTATEAAPFVRELAGRACPPARMLRCARRSPRCAAASSGRRQPLRVFAQNMHELAAGRVHRRDLGADAARRSASTACCSATPSGGSTSPRPTRRWPRRCRGARCGPGGDPRRRRDRGRAGGGADGVGAATAR